LESTVARRGAIPHAVVSAWSLGARLAGRREDQTAEVVREAFRPTGHQPGEADHVLLPVGRYRRAAARGILAARGETAGSPTWVDLHPIVGNPVGASNLLQVAASAALISAGTVNGPGLVVSAGIEGTLSALVLSKDGRLGKG
jgi:hypothetical protein